MNITHPINPHGNITMFLRYFVYIIFGKSKFGFTIDLERIHKIIYNWHMDYLFTCCVLLPYGICMLLILNKRFRKWMEIEELYELNPMMTLIFVPYIMLGLCVVIIIIS